MVLPCARREAPAQGPRSQQEAFIARLSSPGRVVIEIVPDKRIGFDTEAMFANSPAGPDRRRSERGGAFHSQRAREDVYGCDHIQALRSVGQATGRSRHAGLWASMYARSSAFIRD